MKLLKTNTGRIFLMFFFGYLFFLSYTDEYYQEKPVTVTVIDKMQVLLYRTTEHLLIVENEEYGVFHLHVTPGLFVTSKKGDTKTFMLSKRDLGIAKGSVEIVLADEIIPLFLGLIGFFGFIISAFCVVIYWQK